MSKDKTQQGYPVPDSTTEQGLGERLVQLAREYEIPMDADPDLNSRLSKIALPDQIPERVYAGVATLLAFLRDAEEAADE
ncbi:MAG: hypothetical protein AB8C02_00895 [Halioglobus sp.]